MAAAVASTSSHSLSDERYKVKVHVTNPVYVTEISQSDSRCSAEDALKHMKTYDLCDITVINPVFHCELPFSDPEINRFCSVDHVVQNHFYGLGIPNYERITPPSETSFSKSWVDEFPLHSAALEGDIPRIKQLLSDGYNPHQQDKESWTPIHYSCWYGKSETVKVILQQGRCSPTVENENGSTPLHFAAMRGYPKVVQLLLAHQEIDKGALDKDGKTPLHLCEECRQNEWEAVSKLLRDAMRRPAPKIDVHLLDLDSSHVVLDLVSGNNTTVHQLLRQLDLPNGCEHLFAIWIASKNLHLQMRAEHKPLLHMKSWDIIVKQLTNYKPEAEKPRLYLRRDARLALSVENKVKDPQAIKLLFDECLVNVLKSMYPATDEDAISLAAILMQ
uniref:Krev interaction trapped protein 1-like n=1 Tax=Saccoglossus kowalevskii TaxID=10224 RepID=A0ABM0MPM3_SACKO